MRDYPNILVAFTKDHREGYAFEQWSHHVTVLPWFKANSEAIASLAEIARQHLPIVAQIGGTAMFGVKSDILVRRVESEQLQQMHRDMLSQHEGLLGLGNSSFVGENYSPHITLSGTNDPEPGPITIEKLSLVKATGDKHIKRIRKQFFPDNHQ